ncbi:MAG: phosphomannomutase/phosphoglucomutase [Deltaproteobacteria bacterium]|nr:phosphomannomutase/phosphoglucomutase [Deltaproteobacteria bacterium]
MNPSIFREYDIRGIVERDLPPDTVRTLGRAFGSLAAERGARTCALGRDCRLSSPRLADDFADGLARAGLEVLDVGQVPTPLLYFAVQHFRADAGAMITGSHNPPEYNGFKVQLGTDSLHGEGIQELRGRIERGDFVSGSGARRVLDVVGPYLEYVQGNIRFARRGLRVVVDAGNGVAGPVAIPLMRALGLSPIELYCDPDGTFPNHHPDPTVPENLEDLIARVKAEKAELGVAFDGDGDRLGAVDEAGRIIYGDKLLLLLARQVLAEQPGAAVIAEVKCSQTLFDDVRRHGGRPILWRTGHSLIKAKMKEEQAALAGEMSGHLFFAHRYLGFDDAIYASLRLLELVAASDRPLSALLADVPRTVTTPEIRLDCPDETKFEVVRRVQEAYRGRSDVSLIDIDGARVHFPNGWGLVRASNTQPVLVLRFEADTERNLQAIRDDLERAIARAKRGEPGCV